MSKNLSTGYEGEEGSPPTSRKFDLKKVENWFTGKGFACSLQINGDNVGLIYLSSEEEFEWLRSKILGTFIPTEKTNDQ